MEVKAAHNVLDVVDAEKMATVEANSEQVDAADVTTGAALFDLSSYTGGAPLIPMGDGVGGPSAADASHGMFDQTQELMAKNSDGEDKKKGRPSHPAWQYFTRGEKRNRFHHNAYCKFCSENGAGPVAVRGVSGNMIKHLQKCIYCPTDVVMQLKLLNSLLRRKNRDEVKTKEMGMPYRCGMQLCVDQEHLLPRQVLHTTQLE
ncbi:Hypothetical protein PHPALM_15810 [Phytophthora palmivora]|uniref:BED-type domain-containing protein n=1 Tax=Phytophthora palmivora TaxID=4796 RepID=A0A2P4XR78_9STRA|nr:Hypothetical protein PHPALM_15810 [Phytophthora palmivora]